MRALWLFPVLLGLTLTGCGGSPSAASRSTPTAAASSNPLIAPGGLNHLHSIVVMPHSSSTLVAGSHYRLMRSHDGGVHWTTLSTQMMLSLAMDPRHPATLYAVSSQRGLQKSTDSGAHWVAPAGKLPTGQIIGVAYDGPAHAVLAFGNGLYRSVNGGKTFTHLLGHQSIEGIATAPDGADYAATGSGLLVSRDGGSHWKSVASIGNQPIIQVAAAQTTAYAVSPVGLFKSSNNGQTWQMLPRAPTGIEFIGVAPSDPNEVFGEIGNQGFVASYNGGATWHKANQGIKDRDFNASTIRVAPSSPNVVYTGAWGLHIYASHDGGRHWTEVASLKH